MNLEKKNNKRKVPITLIAILVLVLTLGGSFALWTYTKTLGNQTLISGDIFLKYTEGDTINMKEAMPSLTYNPDDYFEFSVEGKNKYKKDVIYEILLDEGDAPTGEGYEARTERIKPELLKFRLVEVTTDEEGKEQEEELIQEASYDSISKKRIWVDRVEANTTNEIKYTYRLYMWISNDTKIGNIEGADYTAEVWNNNVFASVKVGVNGDFNPKDLTEDYLIINAKNESGEPYNLKQPIQSDEDITITLGSKREITKFVVSKSSEYPIALMSLEEPTDYPASYNEKTRAWEATVTLDETGIYDYYAVYPENKGQSKTYSFTLLFNPDRFVKVEKPTSELCIQGLTYTGSPQDLIEEENLDKEGYTIEQVQGTDANSYEVRAHLKDKFRWADSSQEDATFNCTIGPKETVLTYEPSSDFKVNKGSKNTFKITAPTEGTFEVISKESGIASVTFEPSGGPSTTVTVQGVEEGNAALDVKFTPSNNNYTSKTDIYDVEVIKQSTDIIKDQIASHTADGSKLTVEDSDGTIYLSGSNNQITFNYVWYSGKLWRIIAINPDNTIKMITQDAITAIMWGKDTTYKDSWIYQWLNEDFLDTLENQENIIVQDSKWYATADNSSPPAKPTGATIDGKVGLLNAYEYYQSYKNLGTVSDSAAYGSGYLNIGYNWWLITLYDSSSVRNIYSTGDGLNSKGQSPSVGYSVRPSVNLKSDIKIGGGAGTKEDPYRIEGDKEVAKADDKLNSRVSGEYVNFDGKKYRIVGIENDTTKLTSVDYVRDANGAVIKKNFGSKYNNNWGTSVFKDSDDKYWSYYLNNTWYNNISETYNNMLVKGTYYLGQYPYAYEGASYKNAICSESNTTETTKECSKTSSTWTGFVGLPRVGEMFSAQLGQGSDSSSNIWLITPYTDDNVVAVNTTGNLLMLQCWTQSHVSAARPSINLNSNVYITSGEGTEQIPYEIKCDSCSQINN